MRNDTDPLNPQVHSFYHVEQKHFLDKQEIDLSITKDRIVKGVRAEEFDLDMKQIINMLSMEG